MNEIIETIEDRISQLLTLSLEVNVSQEVLNLAHAIKVLKA